MFRSTTDDESLNLYIQRLEHRMGKRVDWYGLRSIVLESTNAKVK